MSDQPTGVDGQPSATAIGLGMAITSGLKARCETVSGNIGAVSACRRLRSAVVNDLRKAEATNQQNSEHERDPCRPTVFHSFSSCLANHGPSVGGKWRPN